MNKVVYARVNNGLEVLNRVVGLLKRKRFKVNSVYMESLDNSNYAHLQISLDDNFNMGVKQAINLLEKLVDVHEVKEGNVLN